MADKIESPFSGFPSTRCTKDRSGKSTFLIAPRTMTPEDAKLADKTNPAGAILLTFLGVLCAQSIHIPVAWLQDAVLAVLAPFVLFGPSLHFLLARAAPQIILGKTSQIKISGDRIAVEGFWGWKTYDRCLSHKFVLRHHDKARAEKEEHELLLREAQLDRKVAQKKVYYGESFHISLDYLGQRNDLLTIYGREQAQAVLNRLNACEEVIESEMGKGQGTPLSPGVEWGYQPGDIPETKASSSK